jgi:hypothetical protein
MKRLAKEHQVKKKMRMRGEILKNDQFPMMKLKLSKLKMTSNILNSKANLEKALLRRVTRSKNNLLKKDL